jgi:hypothetical protein
MMSDAPWKKGHDGCLEAVLGGLIGVVVGFDYGFVFMIAYSLPFKDSGGWAIFGAMMVGGGSAIVGGFVGLGTATTVGVRALVKAVAAKGALGCLIGLVLGFVAGFSADGIVNGIWAWSSEAALTFAFLGGALGLIAGTIVGARDALRKERKTTGSGDVPDKSQAI